MRRVSIASSSQISAQAGADVADRGGNAVDAAVAAAMVSICTEPGLVAPGSSGFITVWPHDGDPVVIDAYAEMPGRGLPPERFGGGRMLVQMDYGGGMETAVGYGTVATPGAIAGLGAASERYGEVDWSVAISPAVRWAEDGFPMPKAADEYFAYSGEPVFGWHPESRAALHHAGGRRVATGERVWVPHLAESLAHLADHGARAFYDGELGHRIADDVLANGGILTREDLAAYEPVFREPIRVAIDEWEVVVNPAPALGGATLAALVLLLEAREFDGWDHDQVVEMARAQWAVLSYRKGHLELADDVGGEVQNMLDLARVGDQQRLLGSPSTIHCSTVDSDGTGCAITMSAGYGSGVMISGTGLWMNNALGEIELHPRGYHGLTPGTRLSSNMAPAVARRGDGATLAIGSPGADRITTAIAQSLMNFMHLGMSLSEAIEHPRLHVEVFGGAPTVAYEPGLAVRPVDGMDVRGFPDRSMYFGGVQATLWDPRAGLFEAADPRRVGGVARGGSSG